MTDKPLLKLKNLNKYFEDLHVLNNISLDIYEGEFLTFLGPSGSGKTTILRCIAGLENIDSGDIELNGNSIKDLAPNKRNVNTVFQNYALFPHLNIYDNIAYGPKIKNNLSDSELKEKIEKFLDLVQMSGYENRMPDQLSGGQRQRIAIARALINEPDILLLDEPLGALDLKLRKHMQSELSSLQKQTGTTFVYITHDQDEALNMSDRIAIMNKGEIVQIGSPRDIYNNPNDLFVTEFIGDRNIKKVEVVETKNGTSKVRLGNNIVEIRCSRNLICNSKPGDIVTLAVHMDKMRIACKDTENSLKGKVVSVHYTGSKIKTEVDVDGELFTVIEYQNNDCPYKESEEVYITWEDSGAVLLPSGPDESSDIYER